MNIRLIIGVFALLALAISCEKEAAEPSTPESYIKATINGSEYVFNQFSNMGNRADRQGRWQIMRASTPKGESPVRQIYCMIYGPSSGINKLDKQGEYDKVRIYYSEGEKNYSAWEGTKNSQAVFDLDSIERTSSAWIYYKSGRFNGLVFNKERSDSALITNGEFKFNF